MSAEDDAPIPLKMVIGMTYVEIEVPRGTTVREALKRASPNVDRLLAREHSLWHFVGDGDLSVIHPDSPITAATNIILQQPVRGGAELGRGTAIVSRIPMRHLTSTRFWIRFLRHLRNNVRRYFWQPLLGIVILANALAVGLFLLERGGPNSIVTFRDALYAVALFMITVGYKADSLSGGGRILAVGSSLLGLLLFGVIVNRIFFSLQDDS